MSRVGLPLLPKLVDGLHNHSTEQVMMMDPDLRTLMYFACFSLSGFLLFLKNPYVKYSNYYIVFSKPYHLCHLSLNNNWIDSIEKTWTPNVQTHILLYPERYFMIKQTLKKQKKSKQFSWITNCVIYSITKLLTWS